MTDDVQGEKNDPEITFDQLPPFPVLAVNHCRRVYINGDFYDNGVIKQHLYEQIKYNKECRPFSAFFVNGVCVHRGYLSKERCSEIEELIQGLEIKISASPLPYR